MNWRNTWWITPKELGRAGKGRMRDKKLITRMRSSRGRENTMGTMRELLRRRSRKAVREASSLLRILRSRSSKPRIMRPRAKYAGMCCLELRNVEHWLTCDSNCGTTSTPLWRRSPQGNTICNACGLYQKARNTARPTTMNRHAQHGAGLQDPAQRFNTHFGSTTATYVSADQTSGGSCPGGGKCNGTGGASGCGGCPAFNNRVSKSAHITIAPAQRASAEGGNPNAPEPIDVNALQQPSTTVVVACQNCETTITPLWRRDAEGHTICNACGKCLSSSIT